MLDEINAVEENYTWEPDLYGVNGRVRLVRARKYTRPREDRKIGFGRRDWLYTRCGWAALLGTGPGKLALMGQSFGQSVKCSMIEMAGRR